jgi:chromosome segregation ATPase
MGSKLKLIILGTLIIAGLGGTVFFALENMKGKQTIVQLEETLARAEKTKALLKRKYAEEKTKANSIQRAKLALEGQKRQLEGKYAELEKKLAALNSQKKASVGKVQQELETARAEVQRLRGAIEKWRVRHDELTGRLKTASAKIQQHEATIGAQSEEIAVLKSDYQREYSRSKRFLAHNQKMASISESILARYDAKGIHSVLIKAEPFTKLKKVELEKIIQNYLDDIDDEVIRDQAQ